MTPWTCPPPTMTDETPPTDSDTVPGLNGGPARCTATSKRSRERCKNPAVKGRTVCRLHGGASLRGPAHPNWRHGKFWALLGDRAGFYLDALEDPALGEFRETIALLDVRTADLIRAAYGEAGEDGAGGFSIRRIRRTWEAARSAMLGGESREWDRAVAEMDKALRGAGAADDAWAELVDVLDKRRKAAASMNLAEARSDRSISAERFDFLLRYVLDSVTRHLSAVEGGRVALQGVARDLEHLLGPRRAQGEA